MKNEDGGWEGISIDLWRHVAERLHLRYRIEERWVSVRTSSTRSRQGRWTSPPRR